MRTGWTRRRCANVKIAVGEHLAVARSRAAAVRAAELPPVRVVLRLVEDDAGGLATTIAWAALTSVFPITLALAAVGGAILSAAGVRADTVTQVGVALLIQDAGTQRAALDAIHGVRQQTGILAVVAFVGFLWTGSSLFGAMEAAFAIVFRTGRRPFVRQKLMSLAMMGLFTVLALVAVGTSAALPLLNQIPDVPISLTRGWLGVLLQVAIGGVAGFVLFFLIYLVVPSRRQSPSRVWPGALFSGIAFEALTQVFPAYIRFIGGMNQYGKSLAFLFILLAFFYLLGLITMVGAELIAVLEGPPPPQPEPAEPAEPAMGWPRRAALGALGTAIGLLAGRRR